jgi:site-specific DNA-methyltransferase (adenine-specific)
VSLPRPYYEESGIMIYHGDCREIAPYLPPVDLVLTDPHYGIDYKHGARKNGNLLGFDGHSIEGDKHPFDPDWLVKLLYRDGKATKSILWGGNHYAHRLPSSPGWAIWDKREGIPSNDQSDCEVAWTNFLSVARLYSRYWNGGGIGEPRFHVNQKPLRLMKWCIGLAGNVASVADFYCGSGTTLRAAKDLGLKAVGIEIEERYAEIAARRLSQEVFKFEPSELAEITR